MLKLKGKKIFTILHSKIMFILTYDVQNFRTFTVLYNDLLLSLASFLIYHVFISINSHISNKLNFNLI